MRFSKLVVSLISVFLLGLPAADLFGKDGLIKYTGRGSRDSNIYVPAAQSRPKVFRDTSSVDSSIYTPPAQSKSKGSGDTPSTQSKPNKARSDASSSTSKASSDTASTDSSISVPSAQSAPKSSGGLSLPPGHKNKIPSKNEASESAYTSKSGVMKIDDIMYSKEDSLVIINGEVYGLHSVVSGGEIVDISPGKVTIKFKNKQKTYKKKDIIK